MDLTPYRSLPRDSRAPRLLAGLAVSSLGDGMSIVTIAWLALSIAPGGDPHGLTVARELMGDPPGPTVSP